MIEDIYLELKAMGKVKSASEFSLVWLGREQSYTGVLRSKRRRPSAAVLSSIAGKLALASRPLLTSSLPNELSQGVRMQAMARRCIAELLPDHPAGLIEPTPTPPTTCF